MLTGSGHVWLMHIYAQVDLDAGAVAVRNVARTLD